MPFDVLVANTAPLTWLEQELERRGITPVPMELLERHKAAQMQKFGRPSFVYQNHQNLYVLSIAVMVTALIAAVFSDKNMSACVPLICALLVLTSLAFILWLGYGTFRQGAAWDDRTVSELLLEPSGVPVGIIDVARKLAHSLQGSQLILGELKLENVVLDPYLLLEYRGERVCLGIWDGKKIIAEPTRR